MAIAMTAPLVTARNAMTPPLVTFKRLCAGYGRGYNAKFNYLLRQYDF